MPTGFQPTLEDETQAIDSTGVFGCIFFINGAYWLCKMDKDYLVLKRASASRPSGEWNDDDFDVLADGVVVGAS